MNRTILVLLITAVMATAAAGYWRASSNIDPDHKFSWDENSGWMNWLDADGGASGVVVATDHLSGYIWRENTGWMNVGDGAAPYANTNDTNYGVNILPGGDLDGFAWDENGGWVNFGWAASTANPDRARFDSGAGRFRGYAWGENDGWINLDDEEHFVGVIACDNIDCLWGDITTTAGGDCVPQCTGAGTDVNFDDVLCALDGFAFPADCPCADIKGPPGPDTCAPNGVIDFDDILTILNAFSGTYDCPLPCGTLPAPIMDPPGRDSAERDAPAAIEPAASDE